MAGTKVSPKWWIESSDIVQGDGPSSLCDVCEHINFKYLIFEIPIMVVSEEIPLDSYSKILDKQHCAFCRIVKYTIDNLYGPGALPTEYQGKAVMISMIATAETFNLNKNVSEPRQLLLWVKPDPLRKGRPPPLEIQHVVDGGWVNSDGKGRIIPSSQIDFTLPLFWNRMCRKSLSSLHKDHSIGKENYVLPGNFRLVDTKKMCIVRADSSFEYIALSYTWGESKQFKLLDGNGQEAGNFKDLTETGALRKYEDQLPQTIKDAMFLVQKLCDRYLWVDALCIIQDSLEDKKAQLPYMDRIYGSSVLTIAATYGNGAGAGLPGVRPNSRKPIQLVETIQGIRLANRPWSFDKSVTDSVWNTRAWTFQERILSSRMLFITEQQIFFKCNHVSGVLAEDLDSKLKRRKLVTYPMDDTGKDIIPQRGSINVLSYQKTVEHFMTRKLSYPGDVLDAFAGIAQSLRPLFRSGFLSGLPQSELDYCLLWEPVARLHRRTKRTNPGTYKTIFPSWSWAGWMGPVRYSWNERLSRVKWVDHSSGALLTSDDYRSPIPAGSLNEPPNTDWRKEWTEKKANSGFRYFYHSSDPEVWFRHPTAPESERRGRIGPEYVPGTEYLRFWAWTDDIQYTGEYVPPKGVTEPSWQFNLTDTKGFATGYFTVPVEILATLDFKNKTYDMVVICRTETGRSREDVRARKDGSELPGGRFSENDVKFEKDVEDNLEDTKPLEDYDDAKDVSMEPVFFPELPSAQEAKMALCFDRQRYDPFKPFCLYEFLVVEWNGDVASRIGIGKIHIDAWAQQHPKEKLITLG